MRVMTLASILLWVPSLHAEEARIPKATVLTLVLDQELEAKKVKKGKEFKARLSQPVTGEAGQVILPAGSEVKGKIEDADPRHLGLKFREIQTPSGKKSIEARLVDVDAENVKVDENEVESPGNSGAKKVATVGTRAGGMATCGLAGSAVKEIGRILFGGGDKELKLKKGTRLRIELKKELKFKLKESKIPAGGARAAGGLAVGLLLRQIGLTSIQCNCHTGAGFLGWKDIKTTPLRLSFRAENNRRSLAEEEV